MKIRKRENRLVVYKGRIKSMIEDDDGGGGGGNGDGNDGDCVKNEKQELKLCITYR